METLRELYRIGRGPSSSHTLAPDRASRIFLMRYPHADQYKIILYGSLAKTGRGHLTDKAILDVFPQEKTKVIFDTETQDIPHPNTMDFFAYEAGSEIGNNRIISAGGGRIQIFGEPPTASPFVYPHSSFTELKAHCQKEHIRLWQYVVNTEGYDIIVFLERIWAAMKNSVYEGLEAEGTLPGGLNVQRKAKYLYTQRHIDESPETKTSRLMCAYAFAASEQNAAGGNIVTAPTCGSCGVVPAVLLYAQNKHNFHDSEIVRALCTAGVIGNLIKNNASISGAECGCQAEIGSACAMAAAALAELYEMDMDQIEYAAEIAIEHMLGLTCDPINGLVQIPCIERNGVAALRAHSSFVLANFLTHTRKISFDLVVRTMKQTGQDLFSKYRETSEGGLAEMYKTQSEIENIK
ncbi:MAG: L-serine ammonia-lyase, iron-sulfur-dependent, subunit alpha [Bacillota bacterium]|nr:L-serine ammonia-lyase, iron-sulfur-dependent, subunit alpha [Bacillota bacterium]